jgi:hypothetical protein
MGTGFEKVSGSPSKTDGAVSAASKKAGWTSGSSGLWAPTYSKTIT